MCWKNLADIRAARRRTCAPEASRQPLVQRSSRAYGLFSEPTFCGRASGTGAWALSLPFTTAKPRITSICAYHFWMNEPQGVKLSAAACHSSCSHSAYTALRLYFNGPVLTVINGTRISDHISKLGAKRTATRFVIFTNTRPRRDFPPLYKSCPPD